MSTTWTLSDIGQPIAVGRTSEIFAVPQRSDRVIKLFLPGTSQDDVAAEVRGTQVAAEADLTPVHCHEVVTVDDRTGLVLDRLDGVSLTRVAERNPLRLRESARELARMQARMHVVVAPGLPEVRDVVLECLDRPSLAFLEDAQRDRARALTRALPEGDRLLHLDYHPENVFTTPDGGYAIIDWPTAVRGAPAADVALSALIFASAEAWPGTPFLKRVLLAVSRKEYARTWLAEYQHLTHLSDEEIAAWRVPAIVLRLGWDIDSERERMRAALVAGLATEQPS